MDPRGLALTPRHSVVVRQANAESEDACTVTVNPSGVSLEALERALIRFALESLEGNRTRAATFLGLSRSALIYRMDKHGIARPRTMTGRGESSQ